VPNQPKTPNATFRIPKWVRAKASAKAKREGYPSLSALVNEWMLDYIADEPDDEDDDTGV
jgi:hypothetical protein